QARKGRGGFYDNGQPRHVPDGVFEDAGGDNFSSPPPGGGRPARGARLPRKNPLVIEGELIAKSTGATSSFTVGDRVFHQKFGNGNVVAVDGNKLTIAFDKAGEKRVVDSFVERV